jgi:DNA-binding CsgD family transcriptional regulator
MIALLSSINTYDKHLVAILENMQVQASIYCKDLNGKYLEVNDIFEKTSTFTRNNIIGNTDKDLWNDLALQLKQNDQHVIKTATPQTMVEKVVAFGENSFFYSHKIPFRSSKNKIIGVFCMSLPLDQKNEFVSPIENKITHNLSTRQIECLYYLANGMTEKQIAYTLKISHKTAEHHLENIKLKLNCLNRFQLIQKAFEFNLIK